jgi:hypothetical protein
MFDRLLRRTTRVDIDRLIFDIAEHKRAKDYEAFSLLISGRAFFLRVDPESTIGIPRGVRYRITSSDSMKLTGLANIQGLRLLPLYTSSKDQRLQGYCAEIDGLEALRMALKTGIDGLLFQNQGNSWVALNLSQVKEILTKLGNR